MRILFHLPGDDADAWLHDLKAACPEAEIRQWTPGDARPADYLLAWKPPAELLRGRTGLKAVFNLGAGVDALLDLLRREPQLLPASVPIIKLDDAGMGRQMVEYVMQAVLRHFRRVDDYEALQRQGIWRPLPPRRHAEHPIGVMGSGALGAQVIAALGAAGFPVRAWSRHPKPLDASAADAARFAGKDALPAFLNGLQQLVNMLPLTPETGNILDRACFDRLAAGAHLVNVARGAHLVEADLLDALASGRIAAATLDVFRQEPLPADHPFWRHPRIRITPHVSALTERGASIVQIVSRLHAMERGETAAGAIDRERGY
ncbi:glyoxylate/hydroxypyruvate reductase A [Noviherbaspirillum humi]|uniref:Glyoxylate/hydroxypyruvate reductase A n=1 Tax=Noviherbaspirillum humi TaxID=1688639 RepID=A0A239L5N0_9BURK|nr:glyoxylate/hydroxypyruvate reductase A [Noviherbaspirillum humi]SNT25208.1 glyoxylate/hydroxypyruvate reductase A [Noviherbaspirillum humi]